MSEAPELKFFATIKAEVAEPIELGAMRDGMRRTIPITGGRVEGPGFSGRILPGGADFQVVTSDTRTELYARYGIALDDGETIDVENTGLRTASAADIAGLVAGREIPPERVYFRCVPKLSGTGTWAWLADRIFLATAERHPEYVRIDVFEVL